MWNEGTRCGFSQHTALLENTIIKYHAEKGKEEDAMGQRSAGTKKQSITSVCE